MHKIDIPQSVVDRVVRHRGREHIYESFETARTALLVVDMQNGFMLPGVAYLLCETAQKVRNSTASLLPCGMPGGRPLGDHDLEREVRR